MAKIFIGIALAVMLATAALGFLIKGNVDKMQSRLRDAKTALTTSEGRYRTAKNDLEKIVEEGKTAGARAEDAAREMAPLKAQTEDLTRKLAEANAAAEAARKELEIAKANPVAPGPVTPVDVTTDPAFVEMRNKYEKAQSEAAEAKQIQDTLNARIRDAEARVQAADAKEKQRQGQFVRAGLSGRILAVNDGWNFVVLSIGDRQGAVVNAPLLVTRNGEPIARARITSVETSTSIADVIPGSVRRGVTVQPNDAVVFEGRSQSRVSSPSGSSLSGAMPVQ